MGLPKLSDVERRELLAATFMRGGGLHYAVPRFVNGRMCKEQWRAWRRLERLGLTRIEGSGEADDMVLTDAGREYLRLKGARDG